MCVIYDFSTKPRKMNKPLSLPSRVQGVWAEEAHHAFKKHENLETGHQARDRVTACHLDPGVPKSDTRILGTALSLIQEAPYFRPYYPKKSTELSKRPKAGARWYGFASVSLRVGGFPIPLVLHPPCQKGGGGTSYLLHLPGHE